MLRNRPRTMNTKQALMADHTSQSNTPTQNVAKQIQSFLVSPRFRAFITKGSSDNEAVMSPTSTLDYKPLLLFGNPFGYDVNPPNSPKVFSGSKQNSSEKPGSKGIGLALIGSETPVEVNSCSESEHRKVLFASKLRVQIPPLSPAGSSESPFDYGIKARNFQIAAAGSPNSTGIETTGSPQVFTGRVPVSEMELSEDYTCVISHGPNPKTTHIFGNCIVESYSNVPDKPNKTEPEDFLSFCHTCRKNLEQKNDIYMYRGEKAFCSHECRYQEMVLDGEEDCEFNTASNNYYNENY